MTFKQFINLNESTKTSSDITRMFEDGLNAIMDKRKYLEFLDYLKTIKDKQEECKYFVIYPYDMFKGSGKIVKVEGPSGMVDGNVVLDDDTSFNPARVIKYFKEGNTHIFIIDR